MMPAITATEQWIVEYVVNCAWQIPLLAAGAWTLVKVMRPDVLAQHWLWLSVLAMAVVLPGRGIDVRPTAAREAHGLLVPDIDRFVGTPGLNASSAEPVSSRETRSVEDLNKPTQGIAGALRSRSIRLGITATRWLVRIYFATVLFGAVRFLRAWFAARQLVRESREATLGVGAMRVFEAFARRLGVRRPCLRESDGIAGPVIVGVFRPVLLIPENFAAHAEEEIGAALCHELAHVRRQDYLVNLICQVAALPVAWHPVVYAVQQRIRRTREMVCDAIAAEEMESGAGYARCLVSLAQQMVNGSNTATESQAMGLFENDTIEERVMKLTETKAVTSGRTRVLRGAFGVAAMLLAMSAVATFHVRPTFAAAHAGEAKRIVVQSVVPDTTSAQTGEAKLSSTTAPTSAEVVQEKPSAQVPESGNSGVSTPASSDEDGPTAIADEGSYVHRWVGADGKKYVMVNQNPKEPDQEERSREEQKLDNSQKDLNELKRERMDLLSSELQREIAGTDISEQGMKDLQGQLRALAELGKQAQIDLTKSPAWQKQMAEMQRKFNDPVWQKQMAELEKNTQLKMMNSPEWQKQFAELQKNPPNSNSNSNSNSNFDFDSDKQFALANAAMDQAKLNDKIAIVMKDNEKQMVKLQKEMKSGELKAKLDAAQRMLDEVRAKMEKMQAR